MTYPQAQDYLNSFVNYERLNFYPDKTSFKLARVRRLLQLLGNPHQGLWAIHIAGTKGKGSTCAFVANILSAAKFKVGLYTSPHLVKVRERIRLLQPSAFSHQLSAKRPRSTDEGMISRRDFARLTERIRPSAESLRKTRLGELSYYEILTSLAFLYFKDEKVDFIVLETGMGGRLDATNVAESSVCAITPISYEHTQVLGNTLKKIAAEKAGIIKRKVEDVETRNQIVITAPQRPVALETIRRRAQKFRADLYEVGKDIQIEEKCSSFLGHIFDVKGILGDYPRLKIKLLGKHQTVNAALAVGCVEALRFYGCEISRQAIRAGLKNTSWPGRLQIISSSPRIVLDGAQNQASARALKDALSELFKFRQLILVLGVSQDKDVRGILKELAPLTSRIILTKTQSPRAMEPETIKTFIKVNERPIILTSNVNQALKIARESAKQQDLILVSGSLFLVAEVLKSERKWRRYF